MVQRIEGELLPGDARYAIVVSRFNDFITSHLVDGAIDAHTRHGGNPDLVTVVYVPGSLEIALAAQTLAKSGKYQAVICLGCVIRGQTDHYDHVAREAAKGISQVGAATGVPVIFGVLTADSLEQAIDRAGAKQGNNGAKAMISAMEMVNVMKKIR